MTESKSTSNRRGRKPAAVEDVVNSHNSTAYVDSVETPETPEDDRLEAAANYAENQRKDTVRDGRVVKGDSVIEVETDEDGVAQETVFKEIPLAGTDRVSYVLVAHKGVQYND